MPIQLISVPGIPEIQPGAALSAVILAALHQHSLTLHDGDVVAVAQKVVSKAENRLVNLAQVTPSARAVEVATQCAKDPRLVELILQESSEISRMRPGVIIVRHRLGFVSANAGIDRSNVAQGDEGETVLLLPEKPDDSAESLRSAIEQALGVTIGVVITDSHGRPHRLGTVGVAIGVAGLPALWDRRGEPDRFGYTLQHTDVAVADEIAAAAGLLMGQAAEGTPVVIVRGLSLPHANGKATDLNRPIAYDLYR